MMTTTNERARALDVARALLDDAETHYPGFGGTDAGSTVGLGDGRTATLRVVFDDDAGIGRWIGGAHHDDVLGVFAWRGRDRDTGLPSARPAGFDGRAQVLDGDARGDRWSGPVWWQPAEGDTDPESTLRIVRRWMRGDWFHVGLVVEVTGGTSESLWGVAWGYDADESHLVETVADLLAESGLDADPFRPAFEEDVAPCFARLLDFMAGDLGAPSAAADLAERGCNPRALYLVADRWTSCDMEPADFADRLRGLADHCTTGVDR